MWFGQSTVCLLEAPWRPRHPGDPRLHPELIARALFEKSFKKFQHIENSSAELVIQKYCIRQI